MAVVDGDTNVIREYDSDDADFGIYNAGEKVTLLCGREDFYNPTKIQQLRSKCVDIKMITLFKSSLCQCLHLSLSAYFLD